MFVCLCRCDLRIGKIIHYLQRFHEKRNESDFDFAEIANDLKAATAVAHVSHKRDCSDLQKEEDKEGDVKRSKFHKLTRLPETERKSWNSWNSCSFM